MTGASFASYICAYLSRTFKTGNSPTRSYCDNCKRQITWYENIPIFSYIFLWGKCKSCKKQIDTKYFIAEIILGLWFLFSYINYYNNIILILQLILGALLLYISLEDLENQEISAYFLYVIVGIAIVKNILFLDLHSLFFSLLISLPYWLIYFFSRGKWIGIADPYLFSALNLFFGAQFGISLILYSSWFGVVFAFVFLKFSKNKYIPFVPIIFLSTLFIITCEYHIMRIQDILIINEMLFN